MNSSTTELYFETFDCLNSLSAAPRAIDVTASTRKKKIAKNRVTSVNSFSQLCA